MTAPQMILMHIYISIGVYALVFLSAMYSLLRRASRKLQPQQANSTQRTVIPTTKQASRARIDTSVIQSASHHAFHLNVKLPHH
jgi:hypothetical protein